MSSREDIRNNSILPPIIFIQDAIQGKDQLIRMENNVSFEVQSSFIGVLFKRPSWKNHGIILYFFIFISPLTQENCHSLFVLFTGAEKTQQICNNTRPNIRQVIFCDDYGYDRYER